MGLEKEKIGVGQIGRQISELNLSVNTHFDISFHDGIFFFLFMTPITTGDRSAAEGDRCSATMMAVTWGTPSVNAIFHI